MGTEMLELGTPEKKRWYILAVFCMLSAFQSCTWFTFSSVPSKVEKYYNLNKPSDSSKVNPTIDLLLNYGPIFFLPMAPFANYLLIYPITGLKNTVRLAATMVFIAAFVRCIPTILATSWIDNDYEITNSFWNTLVFLHVAQMINGAAGPLVLAPPSKLSVIWFGEKQRVFATGMAAVSNTFGTCMGFILGPLIVKTSADFDKLLYFNLFIDFIPFLLVWIYFPNSPNKLPSVAARQSLYALPVIINKNHKNINAIIDSKGNFGDLDSQSNIKYSKLTGNNDDDVDDMNIDINEFPTHKTGQNVGHGTLTFREHFVNFLREIKEIFKDKNIVLIGVIGGLGGGIFAGWAGVLQDMLNPMGGLSDVDIGYIGFNISFMTAVGGMFIGPIADHCFVKNLKKLIIYIYIAIVINLLILFVILPSPFSDKSLIILDNESSTKNKMVVLNIFIGSLGFVTGCLVPPFYELIAEVSYPINEGTSAMYLVFVNTVGCLVFVGVGSWLNTKWETFLVTIICGFSLCIMTFWIKPQYKRP